MRSAARSARPLRQRWAILSRCSNERLAQTTQFRQRTLRTSDLFQAGRDRGILLHLGVMVVVRGDRQMREVKQSQVAVEEFGSRL